MPNSKILFVDDDEKILKGILRKQGDRFDITTAVGPMAALKVIEEEGPFAVVVSDMRMPEMNGVQLLKKVRDLSPNSVRMILTGFAELKTTVEAVNEGHIFRFLAKPCDAEQMEESLLAGLRQYALVEAEKELVEGTLQGSLKVLSDVLSLVSPVAFGQSMRVQNTTEGILKRVAVKDPWQLKFASMLFALGSVTVPVDVIQRKLNGKKLTDREELQHRGQFPLASELLESIPRMDEVTSIIASLGEEKTADQSAELLEKIEILKLALEFDYMENISESPFHAIHNFKSKSTKYSEHLVEALTDYVKEERNVQSKSILINQLKQGMVLAESIVNGNGVLMLSKGQKMTKSAIGLLQNQLNSNSIEDRVKVICMQEDLVPAAT